MLFRSEHYSKLDLYDMRKRWGVALVVKDPEEPPSLANNLLVRSGRPALTSNRFGAEADFSKDASRPTVLRPTPPVEGLRDFNTHRHIYQIFLDLARVDWGAEDDKINDQFVDMVAFEPVGSARSARSGVKRSFQAEDGIRDSPE